MSLIIRLFFAFFKIGAFTFGGGYAMLPMLQKEIVEKNKWAEDAFFCPFVYDKKITDTAGAESVIFYV